MLELVDRATDGAVSALDTTSLQGQITLARLRRDCRLAKEKLSTAPSVDITAYLPSGAATVRVSRTEFDNAIRPPLEVLIGAVARALRGSPGAPLQALVLTGGSAQIPLLQRLAGAIKDGPEVTTVHHAAARGAATLAAAAATSPATSAATFAAADSAGDGAQNPQGDEPSATDPPAAASSATSSAGSAEPDLPGPAAPPPDLPAAALPAGDAPPGHPVTDAAATPILDLPDPPQRGDDQPGPEQARVDDLVPVGTARASQTLAGGPSGDPTRNGAGARPDTEVFATGSVTVSAVARPTATGTARHPAGDELATPRPTEPGEASPDHWPGGGWPGGAGPAVTGPAVTGPVGTSPRTGVSRPTRHTPLTLPARKRRSTGRSRPARAGCPVRPRGGGSGRSGRRGRARAARRLPGHRAAVGSCGHDGRCRGRRPGLAECHHGRDRRPATGARHRQPRDRPPRHRPRRRPPVRQPASTSPHSAR